MSGLLSLQQQIRKLTVTRSVRAIRELLIEAVEEKRSGSGEGVSQGGNEGGRGRGTVSQGSGRDICMLSGSGEGMKEWEGERNSASGIREGHMHVKWVR